jgi:hypothetical protein
MKRYDIANNKHYLGPVSLTEQSTDWGAWAPRQKLLVSAQLRLVISVLERLDKLANVHTARRFSSSPSL